jgi:4-hydroxybenzoate polyprenyltransferase
MNTIERLKTAKLQWPIIALFTVMIFFILPHWGSGAVLVGSALSLVVYSVIFKCHAFVRSILVGLALAACVLAAYSIAHH